MKRICNKEHPWTEFKTFLQQVLKLHFALCCKSLPKISCELGIRNQTYLIVDKEKSPQAICQVTYRSIELDFSFQSTVQERIIKNFHRVVMYCGGAPSCCVLEMKPINIIFWSFFIMCNEMINCIFKHT